LHSGTSTTGYRKRINCQFPIEITETVPRSGDYADF
jgi:hypothetical protein